MMESGSPVNFRVEASAAAEPPMPGVYQIFPLVPAGQEVYSPVTSRGGRGGRSVGGGVFSPGASTRSRSVKISLETRNAGDSASLTIELDDPEAMVEKVLTILSARFPVDAFYSVIANQSNLIRRVVSEAQDASPSVAAATVEAKLRDSHLMAQVLPEELRRQWLAFLDQRRAQDANLYDNRHTDNAGKPPQEGGETSENQTHAQQQNLERNAGQQNIDQADHRIAVDLQRGFIETNNNAHIKSTTTTTTTEIKRSAVEHLSQRDRDVRRERSERETATAGQTRNTRDSRDRQQGENEGPETAEEGKWERLDEEELLADRETEHSSKSRISSSVSSISEAYAEIPELSPIISHGLSSFPTLFSHFVLSIHPTFMVKILDMLKISSTSVFEERVANMASILVCNPVMISGLVDYTRRHPDFLAWCNTLILETAKYTQIPPTNLGINSGNLTVAGVASYGAVQQHVTQIDATTSQQGSISHHEVNMQAATEGSHTVEQLDTHLMAGEHVNIHYEGSENAMSPPRDSNVSSVGSAQIAHVPVASTFLEVQASLIESDGKMSEMPRGTVATTTVARTVEETTLSAKPEALPPRSATKSANVASEEKVVMEQRTREVVQITGGSTGALHTGDSGAVGVVREHQTLGSFVEATNDRSLIGSSIISAPSIEGRYKSADTASTKLGIAADCELLPVPNQVQEYARELESTASKSIAPMQIENIRGEMHFVQPVPTGHGESVIVTETTVIQSHSTQNEAGTGASESQHLEQRTRRPMVEPPEISGEVLHSNVQSSFQMQTISETQMAQEAALSATVAEQIKTVEGGDESHSPGARIREGAAMAALVASLEGAMPSTEALRGACSEASLTSEVTSRGEVLEGEVIERGMSGMLQNLIHNSAAPGSCGSQSPKQEMSHNQIENARVGMKTSIVTETKVERMDLTSVQGAAESVSRMEMVSPSTLTTVTETRVSTVGHTTREVERTEVAHEHLTGAAAMIAEQATTRVGAGVVCVAGEGSERRSSSSSSSTSHADRSQNKLPSPQETNRTAYFGSQEQRSVEEGRIAQHLEQQSTHFVESRAVQISAASPMVTAVISENSSVATSVVADGGKKVSVISKVSVTGADADTVVSDKCAVSPRLSFNTDIGKALRSEKSFVQKAVDRRLTELFRSLNLPVAESVVAAFDEGKNFEMMHFLSTKSEPFHREVRYARIRAIKDIVALLEDLGYYGTVASLSPMSGSPEGDSVREWHPASLPEKIKMLGMDAQVLAMVDICREIAVRTTLMELIRQIESSASEIEFDAGKIFTSELREIRKKSATVIDRCRLQMLRETMLEKIESDLWEEVSRFSIVDWVQQNMISDHPITGVDTQMDSHPISRRSSVSSAQQRMTGEPTRYLSGERRVSGERRISGDNASRAISEAEEMFVTEVSLALEHDRKRVSQSVMRILSKMLAACNLPSELPSVEMMETMMPFFKANQETLEAHIAGVTMRMCSTFMADCEELGFRTPIKMDYCESPSARLADARLQQACSIITNFVAAAAISLFVQNLQISTLTTIRSADFLGDDLYAILSRSRQDSGVSNHVDEGRLHALKEGVHTYFSQSPAWSTIQSMPMYQRVAGKVRTFLSSFEWFTAAVIQSSDGMQVTARENLQPSAQGPRKASTGSSRSSDSAVRALRSFFVAAVEVRLEKLMAEVLGNSSISSINVSVEQDEAKVRILVAYHLRNMLESLGFKPLIAELSSAECDGALWSEEGWQARVQLAMTTLEEWMNLINKENVEYKRPSRTAVSSLKLAISSWMEKRRASILGGGHASLESIIAHAGSTMQSSMESINQQQRVTHSTAIEERSSVAAQGLDEGTVQHTSSGQVSFIQQRSRDQSSPADTSREGFAQMTAPQMTTTQMTTPQMTTTQMTTPQMTATQMTATHMTATHMTATQTSTSSAQIGVGASSREGSPTAQTAASPTLQIAQSRVGAFDGFGVTMSELPGPILHSLVVEKMAGETNQLIGQVQTHLKCWLASRSLPLSATALTSVLEADVLEVLDRCGWYYEACISKLQTDLVNFVWELLASTSFVTVAWAPMAAVQSPRGTGLSASDLAVGSLVLSMAARQTLVHLLVLLNGNTTRSDFRKCCQALASYVLTLRAQATAQGAAAPPEPSVEQLDTARLEAFKAGVHAALAEGPWRTVSAFTAIASWLNPILFRFLLNTNVTVVLPSYPVIRTPIAQHAAKDVLTATTTMAGQTTPSHATGSHAMESHALAGQTMASHAIAGQAMGSQAMAGQTMASHAMGSHAMGSHAMGSHAMTGQTMASHAIAGQNVSQRATTAEGGLGTPLQMRHPSADAPTIYNALQNFSVHHPAYVQQQAAAAGRIETSETFVQGVSSQGVLASQGGRTMVSSTRMPSPSASPIAYPSHTSMHPMNISASYAGIPSGMTAGSAMGTTTSMGAGMGSSGISRTREETQTLAASVHTIGATLSIMGQALASAGDQVQFNLESSGLSPTNSRSPSRTTLHHFSAATSQNLQPTSVIHQSMNTQSNLQTMTQAQMTAGKAQVTGSQPLSYTAPPLTASPIQQSINAVHQQSISPVLSTSTGVPMPTVGTTLVSMPFSTGDAQPQQPILHSSHAPSPLFPPNALPSSALHQPATVVSTKTLETWDTKKTANSPQDRALTAEPSSYVNFSTWKAAGGLVSRDSSEFPDGGMVPNRQIHPIGGSHTAVSTQKTTTITTTQQSSVGNLVQQQQQPKIGSSPLQKLQSENPNQLLGQLAKLYAKQ